LVVCMKIVQWWLRQAGVVAEGCYHCDGDVKMMTGVRS